MKIFLKPDVIKFINALLLSLAGICLFFFLSFALLSLVYDCSMSQVFTRSADYMNPENSMLVRLTAMAQTIGLFGVPALVFGFMYTVNPLPFLFMTKLPRKRLAIYVLAVMIISIPFANFLGEFNRLVIEAVLGPNNMFKVYEDSARQIMLVILADKTILGLLVNLLVVALIPAICEELMFRGLVQKGVLKLTNNVHVAVIVAATIFSFVHFQFYGFFPRLILGVFFGYLLQWSGSMWLSILAHFINNATIVILYFLLPPATMNNLETIGGDAETLLLGLISGLISSVFLYRIVTRYAIQNTVLK